jgi:hypothetical protein
MQVNFCRWKRLIGAEGGGAVIFKQRADIQYLQLCNKFSFRSRNLLFQVQELNMEQLETLLFQKRIRAVEIKRSSYFV